MDKKNDLQAVESLALAKKQIASELSKVIVGQQPVIEELLTALLCGGHVLLVGVPGLAKTLMINTLAQSLNLSFNRIQFTPDLMPSDITGTDIIEEEQGSRKRFFKFLKGPVFANIVLADEINRTPPKTQAALLQAMQERKVTAGGNTFILDEPFFVLATQNPIEQEGTYPLPEAQLDRFMFNTLVDYPSAAEEAQIVKSTTSAYQASIQPVLSASEIVALQQLVRRVPVADSVVEFAVSLCRRTRPKTVKSPDFVKEYVAWGAGPRASQYLILGAKARAILDGRLAPGIDDVKDLALSVLRHRIITNFSAEAAGVDSVEIINRLLG
ncbi:MoxR family ATPase [candidate division TA06 bacterium]|uniref:MoxR family ATPase n=1 Tax=candidate division TA06 bacterium TaxID=2250710 RepID=A0A933I9K1_UNCT6|nr:MoxR family ATPase [candidate division TA06 bacterium]